MNTFAYLSKSTIAFIIASCAFTSEASETVSLDQVIKGSLGDASSSSLLGKSVLVAPNGFGELGFTIAKTDEVTFVCQNGEKSLTGRKPKAKSFEGILSKAVGWDGATVWEMKNCKLAAGGAGGAGATQKATIVSVDQQWLDDCAKADGYSHPAVYRCQAELGEKYAKGLEAAFKSALAARKSAEQSMLVREQAAWRAKAESECKREGVEQGGGGSSEGLIFADCLMKAQQLRTKTLRTAQLPKSNA